MNSNTRAIRPLGHVQLASLAAATGLTIPEGTTTVVMTAEAQAVRWRDDGTDPTASVGMPLAVGVPFEYTATGLSSFKVIEQAPSAKLNVAFYA